VESRHKTPRFGNHLKNLGLKGQSFLFLISFWQYICFNGVGRERSHLMGFRAKIIPKTQKNLLGRNARRWLSLSNRIVESAEVKKNSVKAFPNHLKNIWN
jgi:hypothetical protein